MKYSAHEHIRVVDNIEPDAYPAATVNGDSVDCRGFREALVLLHIGTMATSATLDVKVQHSADNSTWADITGAAFAQKTQAGGDSDSGVHVGRLDLEGCERYIRVVAVTGTDAVDHGVSVALFHAKTLPVSQQNTVGFNVIN